MLEFTVIGTPAPQGSKKGFYNKKLDRVLLVESSAKVKPWRHAVVSAAMDAKEDYPCILGAIRLAVTFTLARPKSAKYGARADRRPDISKLLRSTEDGLTDAGVWEDDARVIEVTALKLYTGDIGALSVPGALIRISPA